MEEIDRKSLNASPDIPKVPIKTYCWEDVRRSRKRGAYPWTHLTKPPFDEEMDPEEYTMDAFRQSRSTSTLDKSETQEVEIPIEDFQEVQKESVGGETLDVPVSTRAKSEEPYKKRKLSVDSSHSRISLPKLRILDRLKTAKSKLKVPKLPKRARSEESALTEIKKQKTVSPIGGKKERLQTIKDGSPVYIHIPLKPPPGETDEFSKYEFELRQSPSGSLTNVNLTMEKKRKTSLLGLLTQIKLAHDQHTARRGSQTSVELKKVSKPLVDSDSDVYIEEVIEEGQIEEQKESLQPTVEIEESGSTTRTDFEDSMRSDKVTIEEVVDEPPVPTEDSSVDDNISECLDKDDKVEVAKPSTITVQERQTVNEHKPDPEKLRKLEATLSKWKMQVPSQTRLEVTTEETLPVRARSEEPKRKRRASLESSHSRKSLSKIAFMKKLKQAKNKIKLPHFPSFSKFDKKNKTPQQKSEVIQKPTEKSKKTQPEKPVYIHIPLKPPPGHSDEFSHLEIVKVEETPPVQNEEITETEPPDSPEDIQLIILTPPSDDEILDSAGPDTPCETDRKFFESLKIEDLKTLAKNAVDAVYPNLETVSEGNHEEEHDLEEQKGVLKLKHQILVDEEDGLKLSEVAIAMINEELEKEYNQQALGFKSIIKTEMSPVLKKKVSFKRKSKTDNGGPIYEDVKLKKPDEEGPKGDDVVVIPLESFQSMSVDEEKSYLDKQIMKTTSLEDDYNKWSKSIDHEYEPINPPPEVVTIQGPPVIQDGRRSLERNAQPSPHHDDSKTLTVHELEKNFEDRFFPKKSVKHEATLAPAHQKVSKSDSLKRSTMGSTSSKGSKRKGDPISKNFNNTLRTQAVKFKTKIQSIKRPKITLPSRPKIPTAKFKRPNIQLPKLPNPPSIHLPTFNFTRKDSWRARQYSTESNAGDSKKKFFDFRTYPRMFDKSKGKDKSDVNQPDFATVPRVSKGKVGSKTPDVIRIPLHSQESMDAPFNSHVNDEDQEEYPRDENFNQEDDDVFIHENRDEDSPFGKELLKRWEHGEFHEGPQADGYIEDIHNVDYSPPPEPDFPTPQEGSMEITPLKENSSGSLSEHRRGVLEEIDSDQFFLREKGISQDDIEVGKYLSSEIREAFRKPLKQSQSEDREYEVSDQSDPIREPPRRKPLRKPKRKKTPHVSSEQLSFDHESYTTEPEEYPKEIQLEILPPIRPDRRKSKKNKNVEDVVPFQETIPISERIDTFIHPDYIIAMDNSDILRHNILGADMRYCYENDFVPMYENDCMKDFEQPKIKVYNPYNVYEHFQYDPPIPPTRRQRSSRSLSPSDQGSMVDGDNQFPIPPTRRQRSSRSLSPSDEGSNADGDKRFSHSLGHSPLAPARRRRSLRSLTPSDHDSIADEDKGVRPHIPPGSFVKDGKRIPMETVLQYDDHPPKPPVRRQRSSRSLSPFDQSSNVDGDKRCPPSLDHSPTAPTRRRRSLRSLSPSDHDSIVDEDKGVRPDMDRSAIPVARRQRSLRSLSPSDHESSVNEEKRIPIQTVQDDHEYIIPTPEPPERPRRTRSCTRSISASQVEDDRTSRGAESLTSDNQVEAAEVVEVTCVKDVRDTSGYAVIDKSKMREPPLPPPKIPKTPPRTRKAKKYPATDDKFATVPRRTGDSATPVRPLRNYSTLRTPTPTLTEDKENQNVVHLQSGEVLQKMRDRPLPAPPRPPRKSRLALRDISHERNLPTDSQDNLPTELEMEMLHQLEDQVLPYDHEETITHGSLVLQTLTDPNAISHSTLDTGNDVDSVVHVIEITREPVDDFSEIPEEFQNLKPPSTEEVEGPPDEDSEVPPDFHELKSPVEITPESGVIQDGQEVSILRAQKLQVADLDVDKLHVNELQASKIIVSELEGVSLQVSEINSKGGNLIVSGIDLSPNLIQEILQKLQMATSSTNPDLKAEDDGVQKKTSIEDPLEEFDAAPPVPPRHDSKTDLLEDEERMGDEDLAEEDPPVRPPRRASQVEKVTESMDEVETSINDVEETVDVVEEVDVSETINDSTTLVNVEINEEGGIVNTDSAVPKSEEHPPPRPPDSVEHELTYIPSQPPPSFYTLRSPHFKEFIDEDIPLPPRRKRHHKPPPPLTASSSEDIVTVSSRRRPRSPEPSIRQLTEQLVRVCAFEGDRSLRRLITHITNNVVNNADGKQDLHVIILLLLIFIAGLILLSEPKVTIYESHWDFFNPPTDL